MKEKKSKVKVGTVNLSGKFIKNLCVFFVGLLVIAALLFVWFLIRPSNKTTQHDLFKLEKISELTTLECRYHNVAVRNNEGGFIGVGRQYVWFEYDVIVEVGVDLQQVQINEPTENGVVRIYLPEAQILNAKEDKATIFKPVCDLGAFTQLTAAEEQQIISDGVRKLKEDAETQRVVGQAYESAKDVLAQYVIMVGEMIGEDYRVEWLSAPINGQPAIIPATE